MTLSEQIVAAIEPVDATLFQLVAAGPNVPSEAEVAEYERRLGFSLPTGFRELVLSSLGGLYVRATDAAWPPMAEFDIVPQWRFLRGVALLGMATDNPEERLDLRFQLDEARERGLTDFAPVMRLDGSGTIWGFDPDGRILVNDTEDDTVELSDEQDLGTLYAREITALIERQRALT
jgi:hypothetical protein